MIVIPGEVKTARLHSLLLGAVAPRPICFASTIDADGTPNLSPFSFFNVFGAKPPILIFSPARRVRDNTIKHTLENIMVTEEVVINVVNYSMVQQTNLASCEYPRGVNEFEKAGFTAIPSQIVRPFRVKESPVQLECRVLSVTPTGTEGGAGNLVICEVLCMHVDDSVLNAEGNIDPHKIDLVARMGGDHYCRASGNAVFDVAKPNTALGIGIDALPEHVRNSKVLTGNDLGILGNSTAIPAQEQLNDKRINSLNDMYKNDEAARVEGLHRYAKGLLDAGDAARAWQALLSVNK
ncbi:flavin reductase family protein [Nemorincola caseinilytica]|uniref:Flavin reductase family protein n=1 Tax=Nemorincola caseinilytica TaxID=2054315 RepID=A0ABP8NM50_9BACT